MRPNLRMLETLTVLGGIVYIYIYIYIHTHTHIYIYIYMYTHTYILCTYIYIYIYTYVYIIVCIYIYMYRIAMLCTRSRYGVYTSCEAHSTIRQRVYHASELTV